MNMRFFITIVLLLSGFYSDILGQNIIDSLAIQPDSLTIDEKEILRKQSLATDFSHTLHKIGDPSIASFAFSDFTHNTDPSLQKKPFILNTTIQPIISIGSKRWYVGNYIHTFQIIPSVTIRVFENDSNFHDHSLPVRTPSFIARFNYLFSHAKLWNESSRYKIYFGMSFFHHSNGQDGYEFNPNGTVNVYNGNFSEVMVMEFLTGGMKIIKAPVSDLKYGFKKKGMRRIQISSNDKMAYWKLSYENHPKSLTTLRFLDYHMYGRNRLNLQLGYLFNPKSRQVVYSKQRQKWVPLENSFHNRETRRIVFNMSYIMDAVYNTSSFKTLEPVGFFDASKRLNLDLTWYERIGLTNDYAIFVRLGYYGSDPYNIYFQQSIFVARAGIAFGNFMMGEKK